MVAYDSKKHVRFEKPKTCVTEKHGPLPKSNLTTSRKDKQPLKTPARKYHMVNDVVPQFNMPLVYNIFSDIANSLSHDPLGFPPSHGTVQPHEPKSPDDSEQPLNDSNQASSSSTLVIFFKAQADNQSNITVQDTGQVVLNDVEYGS